MCTCNQRSQQTLCKFIYLFQSVLFIWTHDGNATETRCKRDGIVSAFFAIILNGHKNAASISTAMIRIFNIDTALLLKAIPMVTSIRAEMRVVGMASLLLSRASFLTVSLHLSASDHASCAPVISAHARAYALIRA